MDSYRLAGIPMSDDPCDLPEEQAQQFYDYFIAYRPERLDQMERLLHLSLPNEAGLTEDLQDLGWILYGIIKHDIEAPSRNLQGNPGDRSGYRLVDRYHVSELSLSVCFDVSVCFGQMMVNHIPGVEWAQCRLRRKDGDVIDGYLYPVVQRTGWPNQYCFVYRTVVILAQAIAQGDYRRGELDRLYQRWKDTFLRSTPSSPGSRARRTGGR